jgi:hypothetical protein
MDTKPQSVNPDVCFIRHQLVDSRIDDAETRIDDCKTEVKSLKDDIKEVRDLQKLILYTLIGLFGATILTLIGVIAGRAIDFGVFFS